MVSRCGPEFYRSGDEVWLDEMDADKVVLGDGGLKDLARLRMAESDLEVVYAGTVDGQVKFELNGKAWVWFEGDK